MFCKHRGFLFHSIASNFVFTLWKFQKNGVHLFESIPSNAIHVLKLHAKR